jgi:hypothetical protein
LHPRMADAVANKAAVEAAQAPATKRRQVRAGPPAKAWRRWQAGQGRQSVIRAGPAERAGQAAVCAARPAAIVVG